MQPRRRWTRRRVLKTAALSGLAALGLYAWRVEPHWLEVVRRTLPIRNLPESLSGATLVQLSDLHIGPQVDDGYLSSVFDLVRKLAPEIVVYTGDFISTRTDVTEHAPRMFQQLVRGSLGTYGILGNHDFGSGWRHHETAERVVTLAEEAGVRMLRNEVARLQGLQIVGLDELWAECFQPRTVWPQLHSEEAALVLVHNPDAVDRKDWEPYSGWILAGHTHGGQCKPPFLPPPIIPVQNSRYTSGEFDLSGNRRLYISRGVGHLLRARFNARPEVTLFQLVRATAENAPTGPSV